MDTKGARWFEYTYRHEHLFTPLLGPSNQDHIQKVRSGWEMIAESWYDRDVVITVGCDRDAPQDLCVDWQFEVLGCRHQAVSHFVGTSKIHVNIYQCGCVG